MAPSSSSPNGGKTTILAVSPGEIVFENVLPGLVYAQSISIRNLHAHAKRVRAKHPQASGPFSLKFTPGQSLAPGLSLTADVQFELPESEEQDSGGENQRVYRDRVVFGLGPDEQFEVPLRAVAPNAKITLVSATLTTSGEESPSSQLSSLLVAIPTESEQEARFAIRLGEVVRGSTSRVRLELRNFGPVSGDFTVEWDDEDVLGCVANKGTLGPDKRAKGRLLEERRKNSSLEYVDFEEEEEVAPADEESSRGFVTFDLRLKKLGSQRCRFVLTTDQLLKVSCDLSCVVVEQRLALRNEDGSTCGAVDFGGLFYGQTKRHEAILVNSSSLPVPFVVALKRDDEDDGALTVQPMEGVLEPYETQKVVFGFAPPQPPSTHKFRHLAEKAEEILSDEEEEEEGKQKKRRVSSRPYAHGVQIVVAADLSTTATGEQPPCVVDVDVTARAAPAHCVRCSPRTLRFGNCEIGGSHHKALVTLENASDLGARFEFERLAHFSLQPRTGRVAARGCATVVVTFHPAAIGSFDLRCTLNVEGGLHSSQLRLLGTATMLDNDATVVVGGEAKYVLDHHPRNKGGAYAALLSSGLESSGWDHAAARACNKDFSDSFDLAGLDVDSQTAEELVQRDANRAQYVTYIRKSRARRETARARSEEQAVVASARRNRRDPRDVDLALTALEEPPLIALPVAKGEPLWMATREGDGSMDHLAHGAAFDPEKPVALKYKPKPTTQAESRHCSTRLVESDLAKVVTNGLPTLDFGRVCAGSAVTRNFAVKNGLTHAVLVAVSTATLPLELAASTSLTQVLPAEAIAGFDLTLEKEQPGLFKATLQYSINDRHICKLQVVAEVVPVELLLSSTSLEIEFDRLSLEPSVEAEVRVTNPGNCAVEVFWTFQPPFAVSPEQSVIAPYSCANVAISFAPQASFAAAKKNTAVLRAHLNGGGADLELQVKGVCEEAKCAFSEKKLDFGTLAIGDEADQATTVVNTGDFAAVCTLEVVPAEAAEVLQVSQTRFKLAVGGSQRIAVKFRPQTQPLKLLLQNNATLICNVRGARPLRLPLFARALAPEIRVFSHNNNNPDDDAENEVFDFGEQFVGFVERRTVLLQNKSEIGASFVLDLTQWREFDAKKLKEQPQQVVETTTPEAVAVVVAEKPTRRRSAGAVATTVDDPETAPSNKRMVRASSMEPLFNNARRWSFYLAPESTLAFELVFSPTAPSTHDFEMKFDLPNGGDLTVASTRVRASATRPILLTSKTTVDFGERVVTDVARPLAVSTEVQLTNNHHCGLLWTLGDEEEEQAKVPSKKRAAACAFVLLPRSGKLVPGESTTVRVTFAPTGACDYEAKFPLYLALPPEEEEAAAKKKTVDFSTSKAYLTLAALGSGAHPRLEVVYDEDYKEQQEGEEEVLSDTTVEFVLGAGDVVVLPSVPLGVVSRARFFVRNRGFENIDLNFRLPPHLPVDLKVDFPEGRSLGLAKPQVPVVVSFRSEKPVSFCSALHLLDSDGHAYSVAVAGTADNCALSTHAFLTSYAQEFTLHARENEAPRLLDAAAARKLLDDEIRDKEQQRAARRLAQRGGKSPAPESPSNKSKPPPPPPPAAVEEEEVEEAGVDFRRAAPRASEDVGPLVVAFLDYHALGSQVGSSEKLRRIPDDLVASNGRLALDAVESLAGGRLKVPNRARAASLTTEADLIAGLVAQYKSLLTFLKERGAFLSSLRPEMLLSKAHYLHVREDLAAASLANGSPPLRMPRAAREARYARWERKHARVSSEAWLAVMLQAIRVFTLSRLTPQAFASCPGVLVAKPRFAKQQQVNEEEEEEEEGKKKKKKKPSPAAAAAASSKKKADSELEGSNVFSQAECVLLKWLGYHVAQGGGATSAPNGGGGAMSVVRRVTGFEEVFRDATRLTRVVASHAPWLAERGAVLDACGSDTKKTAAARRFEKALKQLRCSISLQGLDDGDDGDDDDDGERRLSSLMALTGARGSLMALHLFLCLPAFVPKTTVEFEATLGVATAKLIELRNPSQRAVAYDVVLEGASDFEAVGGEEAAAGKQSSSSSSHTVLVEAKASASYAVRLLPRFSKAVEARLTFFALPCAVFQGGPRQTPLVFSLRSNVEKKKQLTVVAQAAASVYEPKTVDIALTNPFDKPGVFQLTLFNSVVVGEEAPAAAKQQQPGRGRPAAHAVKKQESTLLLDEATTPELKLLREAFWTSQATVKMEALGTTTITLQLLALSPGLFKCELDLVNADVGEFVVEARAHVGACKPTWGPEPLRFALESSSSSSAEDAAATPQQQQQQQQQQGRRLLRIPAANPALDRAMTLLCERLPAAERQAALQGLLALLQRDDDGVTFKCVVDSPYFRTPDDVQLSLDSKQQSLVKKPELVDPLTMTNEEPMLNAASLSLLPERAGLYSCRVSLEAQQQGSSSSLLLRDLRCFLVEATVTAPKVSTTLEFTVPARQRITQELPLKNASEEDWILTAQFLNGSRSSFTGPKNLKIPAGGKASYSLTFAPGWISSSSPTTEEATLLLVNPRTNDTFEYVLKGTAEPPLAEGHAQVRCNAREAASHFFKVENRSNRPLSFAVESDLPFVSGAATFEVAPNSAKEYELKFSPSLGGHHTGSVTFTAATSKQGSSNDVTHSSSKNVRAPLAAAEDEAAATTGVGGGGEYLWYTVGVQVDSPLEESAIEIATTVRKAASAVISLQNPFPDDAIEFEVVLQGAGLIGESVFVLGPGETRPYEFFYSPLVAQRHEGAVVFLNDRVGEFWYKLALSAERAEPKVLPCLECAVGARTGHFVTLENPLDHEIFVESSTLKDANNNFAVEPASVTLAAYASTRVQIQYTPSTLGGDPQTGEVTLRHAELGDFWQFLATGVGTAPGVMPEQSTSALIGEPASYMFTFRNPFTQHPLTIDVSLVQEKAADDDEGGFSLLMRRTRGLVLAPSASVSVPLLFEPKSIAEHLASVEITALLPDGGGGGGGAPLGWTFPLRGVVNAPLELRAVCVRAKAKTSTRQTLELGLSALAGLAPGGEDFTFEVTFPAADDAPTSSMLTRALHVVPIDLHLATADSKLKFQVVFEPTKGPLAASAHLVVKRAAGGGRWPFEIQVEAEPPDPDDSILIEANLHATSTVTFTLRNNSMEYSPFTAFFTTDSADTLNLISPSHGVLPPADAAASSSSSSSSREQPAQFAVAFSPVNYGTLQRGRLIVQTEFTMWSYEIQGKHPTFTLPEPISKVDSHIDKRFLPKKHQAAAAATTKAHKQTYY